MSVNFSNPTLEDRQKVWRYLTFSRFVWLLQNKKLWLGRADTLEDPWEIAITGEQLAHVISRHLIPPISEPSPRESAMARAERINAQWRENTYVNCWCASEHESHALWRIYCGPTEGVAIQTTLGKLKLSIGKLPVLPIVYGALGSEPRTPTLIDLATRKRPMYEYEHEVRVVVTRDTQDPKLVKGEFGFQYPFALEDVIETVAVHHEADRSFMETATALVTDYVPALRRHVEWSAMKERPPFFGDRHTER
jgi:hypothetical protein